MNFAPQNPTLHSEWGVESRDSAYDLLKKLQHNRRIQLRYGSTHFSTIEIEMVNDRGINIPMKLILTFVSL